MQNIYKINYLTQEDGTKLRYGIYAKDHTKINKYVVFLNGRTEWIEKYLELPSQLGLDDDCAFLTWDHRGQGGSDGIRADSGSYDIFADDTKFIIESLIEKDQPYTMISHSMGGLISLYTIMQQKIKPLKLYLSSPLLGMPSKPVPQAIAAPVAKTLSLIGFGKKHFKFIDFNNIKFEDNALTHDAKFYKRIQSSPYLIPIPTFDWIVNSVKAINFVHSQKALDNYSTPTMLTAGSADTVVDFNAFSIWINKLSKNKDTESILKIIQGAKHELFVEAKEFQDPAIKACKEWLSDF